MLAKIDFEPPAFEHFCTMGNPLPWRRACRRHKPHLVADPQGGRHQGKVGFGEGGQLHRPMVSWIGCLNITTFRPTDSRRTEGALGADVDSDRSSSFLDL